MNEQIIVILVACIIGSYSILDLSAVHQNVNVLEQNVKVAGNIRTGGENRQNVTRSLKSNKIFSDMLKHAYLIDDNDWQYAINCGPKGSHIKLRWRPKVIDPDGQLTISLQLQAPVRYNNGTVKADVYTLDNKDPIFSIEDNIACSDIQKLAPFIHCPLQKNFPIWKSYTFTKLTKLPMGDYVLVIRVTNEKNELFACLNGTVYIEPY